MPEPKLGESRTAIDVAEIVASRRFAQFQLIIVALCTFAMFADGFNTQVLAAMAPAVARSMGVNPGALGPVYSFGVYGIVIGILVCGPLADWLGRKPVIIGTMLLFAIVSIATVWAQTVTHLILLRFVAGLGLGGLIPNALALTAEYMPKRNRASLTLVVWVGFSLGSGVAGPIATYVLHNQRWPVLFVLAGLMPIVLLPLVWTALPESLQVLVRRGERENARIRATLITISRRYDRLRVSEFTTSERPEQGFPIVMLFQHGRAPITALLWIMFFCGLVTIFFVNSWLPTVLNNVGFSESTATIIAALTQFGGIVGGFFVTWLADRLSRFFSLGVAYLLGAVFLVAVGLAGHVTVLVAFAVFFAGMAALSAQNAATAIVAASYPSAMRATGVGWALGVGRNGQLISPMIGGYLISLRWESSHLLYVVALPGLVAAVAALYIAWSGRRLGDEAEIAAS